MFTSYSHDKQKRVQKYRMEIQKCICVEVFKLSRHNFDISICVISSVSKAYSIMGCYNIDYRWRTSRWSRHSTSAQSYHNDNGTS